ncbi:MAG TPA: metallophosphoesterase [Ramlibacter sp.]|uniref:metallophosphoesterase n=1 Tax=Ramlibacter sp. TaxID=1917967 RepID=UPI002BBFFDE6|nr:metallophosphoesterase [Ramlibacter sp.]HVZ42679.1 metallophosphoesterase [Ramlibacter sp.]
MSLLFLLGLSAALHLYIGARLVPELADATGAMLLALLLAASALLVPLGLIARRVARPPLSDRLAWVGLLFMGLFSSLLVGTFLRDLVLLAAAVAVALASQPHSIEWLRAPTAAAVPVLGLAVTAIGFLNARRTARPVYVPVALETLAEPLQGFRIVQISDIHVGPTIKGRYLEAIVRRVNGLAPDLVAITGDLVDGSVADLRAHVAVLAQLRARHGVFFVTGNHEYYSGAHAWLDELRALGIRVLLNEHVVIRHDGASLVVGGIPDYSAAHFDEAHRPDAQAALEGAPEDCVKVLLAHQPRSAPAAAAAGFDLQLSGHTHGGQFLPWNWFVRLQQPWTAGLHRVGRMWLYVSRGTGYWGPPKRFGAPSEITELMLVRAPA